MSDRFVTSDDGTRWEIGPMLAYQGKEDCRDARCTRTSDEPGCRGWHCPACHAPTSSQGHKCPEASHDQPVA